MYKRQNLNNVYTYTVLPINIDQNTFTNFKATTPVSYTHLIIRNLTAVHSFKYTKYIRAITKDVPFSVNGLRTVDDNMYVFEGVNSCEVPVSYTHLRKELRKLFTLHLTPGNADKQRGFEG